MKAKARGFSLIELMVTIAIVGILAAIAIPSYSNYVVRGNRSAAQSYILSAANKQEQYMLDARQYANTMALLGLSSTPTDAPNYSMSITVNNSATPPTYTITATPTGSQATRDTQCGNLTIDQSGTKGISGTGTVDSCW